MARKPTLTVDALSKLGADKLAGLILDEVGRNAAFKKIVTAALAATNGPDAVAAIIDRRLAALEQARGTIVWEKTKAFAEDLAATVSTIAVELGALDPGAAIDRLLRFILGAGAVEDRVGDSNGAIAKVYDDAADAVPRLAATLKGDAKVDLAERLIGLMATDDARSIAGVLGDVIRLLPLERLPTIAAALAAADEALGGSRKESSDDRVRGRRDAIVRLRKVVAECGGDVDAFIALELQRPDGVRDTVDVAARLLTAGRLREALDWARRTPRRGIGFMSVEDVADGVPIGDSADRDRVRLEIRILDAMGERDAAQALRWEVFGRTLDADTLRDIVAHCPDFGEFEAVNRAFGDATAHPRRYAALCFFLAWPDLDRTAKLVLDHRADWKGKHYGLLLPAAETLAPDHPAAATVLYRALIDDILVRGRSQAYGHATRHLAVLDDLAATGGDAVDHAAYRAGLRRIHGRKAAFWTVVDGPKRARASRWS